MRRPSAEQRGSMMLVLAATCLLVAARQATPAVAQQQTFSTSVERVLVDVDVRRGPRLTTGLSAADFEVLDNGIRQTVELVSASSVPVSVILVLDTSASLDATQRAHLVRAGTRVIDELKPDESAALVTFSHRIAVQTAFTTDLEKLRGLVAKPVASGDTALRDAVHVAMLVGASAPGRPLVILLSDGDDTASFLSDDAVLDTAQRTGAVVSVVKIGGDNELLKTLAGVTGGELIKERSLDRVAERFSQLLDSFRNRYLLSFAPTDRSKPGWHRLTVRVRGEGDVRARTGYWAAQ